VIERKKPIKGLSFSMTGDLVCAAGEDTEDECDLAIVDDKGIETVTWVVKNVMCMALHNQTIVLGLNNGTATLWNVSTQEVVHSLEGHSHCITKCAFSPDGSLVATVARDKAYPITKQHSESNHMTCIVWDVASGDKLCDLKGHSGRVYCVVFDSDSRTVFTGSADHTVRAWDVGTGECVQTFDVGDDVWQLALQGHSLYASVGDGTFTITDTQSWSSNTSLKQSQETNENRGGTKTALSSDGRRIALGFANGGVVVRDVNSMATLYALEAQKGPIERLMWSADGQVLLTLSILSVTPRQYRIVVSEGRRERSSHSFRFSGDLLPVCVCSSFAAWCDAEHGVSMLTFESNEVSHPLKWPRGKPVEPYGLAVTRDGRLMASGHKDGQIIIWNMTAGGAVAAETLHAPARSTVNLVFSDDGKRLVSGARSKTVSVWCVATGECEHTIDLPGGVCSLSLLTPAATIPRPTPPDDEDPYPLPLIVSVCVGPRGYSFVNVHVLATAVPVHMWQVGGKLEMVTGGGAL
jgi:WD40 repeat protein